jgi:hypothetical protein
VKLMKIMRPVAERRKAMQAAMAAASLEAPVEEDLDNLPALDDSEAKADAKGASDDPISPSKEVPLDDDAKGAPAKDAGDDPLEGSMDSKGEPIIADAKGEPTDADDSKGSGAGDKDVADEK